MDDKLRKGLGGLLGLALCTGLVGCGMSNDSSVSGTVTDEVGVPIAGAVVAVKGSDALTTTDEDGDFDLDTDTGDPVIEVTAEGMDPYEATTHRRWRGRHQIRMEEGGEGGPCDRMDADGDGQVTADEWKGPEEIFVSIDTDGDGVLSAAELEAGRERHREAHENGGPCRMDADGDGVVTADEWQGPAEIFAEMDADGDGQITESERDAAFEVHRGRHAPPPPAN